jgi:cation diffusion facilitator family transporter
MRKNLKRGERAAGTATLVSFLLAIGKGFIGYFSGSLALMADALNSGADVLAMFASWLGLRLSQRKPDEKFQYGYYKAENLAAMVVSIFILLTAVEILLEGISRISAPLELDEPFLAMGAALISAFAAFWLSVYLKREGSRINSPSLLASSKDRLTDIAGSSVVFVAILSTYLNVSYVEPVVAVLMSLLVMKVGLEIAKDSILALMDIGPSRDIEKKAKKIIQSVPGVEAFTNLRLRKAGPFIFGEVDIEVKKSARVQRAHEIADNVENEVKRNVRDVEYFTVHVEPHEDVEQKLAMPVKADDGLDSEVMDNFGRATYFLFVTLDEGKVMDVSAEKNRFKERKTKAGLSVSNYLTGKGVTAVVTRKMGEISFHTLRDHLIEVYETRGRTAKAVVNNFVKGKLKPLPDPYPVTNKKS